MRIYDLAKEIGRRCRVEVKSTDLANEIREMPEFRAQKNQIKSHASTVDEAVVKRMIQIYEARAKGGSAPKAEAPASAEAAPKAEAAAPPPPKPAEPARRPAPPSNPAPPRPPQPSASSPLAAAAAAAVAAIAKAQNPGAAKEPPAREPEPPTLLTPQQIEAERARRRAEEMRRREEIDARRRNLKDPRRAPTPPPVASPQVEGARAVRGEILRHKGVVPPAGAPPRPAPMPPPNLRKPRLTPIPLPMQKTVGEPPPPPPPTLNIPVRPAAPAPAAQAAAPAPAAQPAAAAPAGGPVAPTVPAGPRPQGAPVSPRPTTGPGGVPRSDSRGGPGGPPRDRDRGGDRSRPGSRDQRPGPGATRTGPGGGPSPRPRNLLAGQPPPPALPNFGADSPFRKKEPAPPREARRPVGADDRRPPPRGDRPARPGAPEPLVIPTLEAIKETPGRRGGGKGGDKGKAAAAAKKKGLKTIVRDEIEVKPTKLYSTGDEFRRPMLGKAARGPQRAAGPGGPSRPQPKGPAGPTGPISIGSTITVGEFAEKLKTPVAEIIRRVFMMGKPLTINQLIDPELCELVAQDMGVELAVETEGDEHDVEQYRPVEDAARKKTRPPVVTIMGHVDHGKTTLLDAYRSSSVVQGEFGGITQHIGAYHVDTPRGEVVFLDTPGHEAFTSMRARGAKVTDIVVVVVAADDGVMPQTVEAINHAKEAGVPIVIAVNKMDLPQANPDRVRTELMQYSILPEELGGTNIFVNVSAKQRTNLDQLLEMILLQAEVLELRADADCRAEGTIIESHVDPLRGSVATVLVQKGTLRQGDVFVVGSQSGRVRVMIDDRGRQVKEATPAHPVEVIGLSGTPEVGELFVVMQEERLAREIASRRTDRRRMRDLGTTRHVSLEGLHELVAEGKLKDLKLILKADVQGSVEAIRQALGKLSNQEVRVQFLHSGTGGITESDVNLANASDAIVIGFNVRPDPAAASLAQQVGIEIKTYRVIYELIEEIQKAIVGMLDKVYREVVTGRAEIRQVFKASRLGNIAGCMVLSGELTRGSDARVVRDGVIAYQGKIATLRRVKEDVTKVASGFECGLTLENFNDIKQGDILELFKMEEEAGVLPAGV